MATTRWGKTFDTKLTKDAKSTKGLAIFASFVPFVSNPAALTRRDCRWIL